jgi:hypothetical protein
MYFGSQAPKGLSVENITNIRKKEPTIVGPAIIPFLILSINIIQDAVGQVSGLSWRRLKLFKNWTEVME